MIKLCGQYLTRFFHCVFPHLSHGSQRSILCMAVRSSCCPSNPRMGMSYIADRKMVCAQEIWRRVRADSVGVRWTYINAEELIPLSLLQEHRSKNNTFHSHFCKNTGQTTIIDFQGHRQKMTQYHISEQLLGIMKN